MEIELLSNIWDTEIALWTLHHVGPFTARRPLITSFSLNGPGGPLGQMGCTV